jgi:hypothetical protein
MAKDKKNPVVKKVLDKVQRVVVGPKPADPDTELKKLTGGENE